MKGKPKGKFEGNGMNWSNYDINCKCYGQPRGCTASAAISLLILAIFTTSCKHIEYVSVPEVHTDTLYISKVQHDSIHVKDSVYVHEYTKGDTVFVEVLRWQTKWRERLLTDTIKESRVDSVAVPYPVEVVKTKATGWWAFWGLVVAIVTIGTIGTIKRLKS